MGCVDPPFTFPRKEEEKESQGPAVYGGLNFGRLFARHRDGGGWHGDHHGAHTHRHLLLLLHRSRHGCPLTLSQIDF